MADGVAALEELITAIGEERGLDHFAIDRVFSTALGALERETAAARERRVRWALLHGKRHSAPEVQRDVGRAEP